MERKRERENRQDQTRKKKRIEARLNCTKEGIKGEKGRQKYSFHPYTPIFTHTYGHGSIRTEAGWHDLMDLERRVDRARHGVGWPLCSERL